MRRGAWVIAVVVGLLGLGCAESKAGAPTLEYTGSDAGFYVPPSPLPAGKHGELIRYQRLASVPKGSAYRVMYRSESVAGKPIAVTGLAAIPTAAGTNRPVLSWAHGTAGIADVCAPSKHPAATFDAHLTTFLTKGWDVVATDYEGLGTPGRHPYIAGISEGRGVLDIVRAARQLPRAAAGPKTLVWGHSQGGHAALFASQLATTWTPELHLVGTVAGAPPSELPLLAAALQGGAFQGYIAMVAAGLNAAYPKATLSSVLKPKGLSLLPVVDTGCTDRIFKVFDAAEYDDVIKADPTTVPVWRAVLEANDPGHVTSPAPLLIIHGEADEQIPPIASALLFNRLCGLKQVVERRTYPGRHHADVITPSFGPMVQWMTDRVAGKPAVSGCPKK